MAKLIERLHLNQGYFVSLACSSLLMSLGCQFWGQDYNPCLDDEDSEACSLFESDNDESVRVQEPSDGTSTEETKGPSEGDDVITDALGPEVEEGDNPAEQSETSEQNINTTTEPGSAVLTINEVSASGIAFVEILNSGDGVASSGSFNVVIGESTQALNRRCLSSFALAPKQLMLFVTDGSTCEKAPDGVDCQVCNFELSSSQGSVPVTLNNQDNQVISQVEYPGTDEGGPGPGFSWRAFPDGEDYFSVASATLGSCNDSDSLCESP